MPRYNMIIATDTKLMLFLLFFVFHTVSATTDNPELTFEQLYLFGREAYTVGEWHDCVAFLRKALTDFNEFRDDTRWCRQKCERYCFQPFIDDCLTPTGQLDASQWTTTHFMYARAQRALCLLQCQQEKFTPKRPPLEDFNMYNEFNNRRPYHYLQYCYWKLGDLKNAASSAYTYLIANPMDKDSLSNLEFYMEQPGFERDSMLVDVLRSNYERLYVEGIAAYDNYQWQKCIESLESAFAGFLAKWHDCRLSCEDHLDWSSLRNANPELSVVITSLYSSVLRCRSDCVSQLSRVNGRDIPNFLASIFEYLHVCQFRVNRGRDACQSVQNALILHPKNILTKRNKIFYAKTYAQTDLFKPSIEVVEFLRKTRRETKFLTYVDEKFRYTNNELVESHSDDFRRFEDPADEFSDVDSFDLLRADEQRFLDDAECRMLARLARFKQFGNSNVIDALVHEVKERVVHAYDSPLITFHSLTCFRNNVDANCKRGIFILNVDTTSASNDDTPPCGAIMAEGFSGCALVFCTF